MTPGSGRSGIDKDFLFSHTSPPALLLPSYYPLSERVKVRGDLSIPYIERLLSDLTPLISLSLRRRGGENMKEGLTPLLNTPIVQLLSRRGG
jgi:hypothetical protein